MTRPSDRTARTTCWALVTFWIVNLVGNEPGGEQQMVHRDEDVWVNVPQPRPEIQLASVIALVDFTPENGATRAARVLTRGRVIVE